MPARIRGLERRSRAGMADVGVVDGDPERSRVGSGRPAADDADAGRSCLAPLRLRHREYQQHRCRERAGGTKYKCTTSLGPQQQSGATLFNAQNVVNSLTRKVVGSIAFWHGWHRHVSLVMLAFAMLAVIRHRANAPTPQKTRSGSPGGSRPYPLVGPRTPPCRRPSRAATHPARPRRRLVGVETRPPSRRTTLAPEAKNATVMIGLVSIFSCTLISPTPAS
jgi:hypothetical protein